MKYLILSLLFLGCATEAKYQRTVSSWVGHHSNELIEAWGIPHKTQELGNGRMALEYSQTLGSTTTGNAFMISTSNNWCRTTFFTDERSYIQKWGVQGNSCRSK